MVTFALPGNSSNRLRLAQLLCLVTLQILRQHNSTDKPHIMNAPTNPNKALWEKGDFTRIADTMRESGEALVQRLGITQGLKVLDLGCGDGTTALPEAKLGADVLGVDIARNLADAGNSGAH